MRLVSRVTATLISAAWLLSAAVPQRPVVRQNQQKLLQSQIRTPIAFEPNVGQAPSDIRWVSRTPDRTFLLSSNEARMIVKSGDAAATLRMKLLGAASTLQTEGVDLLPSTSNYFLGNNPAEWRTAVPHYSRVRYKNVYAGIDVVYYSSDRHLEYDFVLSPGADPSAIELAYEGADRITTDRNGDLIVELNGRVLRQLRPKVYQEHNGERVEVAASYRIGSGNRVEFALASYDKQRELVIDPVLQYSTYFGQEGYDTGNSVAVDKNGDIYMTGVTTSTRFNVAQQAQELIGGESDAFVAKFSGSGNLAWVTYLGGRRNDTGRDIALDSSNNVYVVGSTQSDNFPVRNGPNTTLAGEYDAFVTKISPDGRQFLFSSYLGGSFYDEAIAIAIDAAGDAYVTGLTTSLDFPTRGAFQTGGAGGGGDIFVTKFSPSRGSVVYSTYVGGNGIDTATGIAVDPEGNAYVSGGTTSTIFPVFAPIQGVSRGDRDAFLFKLNAAGNSLVYSTFLGGSMEDFAYKVALDTQRAAYVFGYTKSPDFPTRGAYQATPGGLFDAFVTKINPEGSAIVYSTYLGGAQDDFGFGGIVVDAAGSAYVSGYSGSQNFPTLSPLQMAYGGGRYDAFLTRLNPQGNGLLYSTLFGGSGDDYAYALALDPAGQVVLSGRTTSPNLPGVNNAFVGDARGAYDVFLARVAADASINFITVSQSGLTFSVRPGAPAAPQTIGVGTGGAPLTVNVQADQPWLRATLDRNTTPATVTVSVDAATLPATPTASGVVTVSAPLAANSPIAIPVNVNQTVVPVISGATPASVTREATDTTVTLTGSGFSSGLSVRVNNTTVAHTVQSATSLQVTVPGAIRSAAQSLEFVVFTSEGVQSAPFQVPIVAPGGEFTIAPNGIVNAATNQPGVLAPGEIITIYGTGFGPAALTNGAVSNGMLATTAGGVRVLIDNIPAPILYAKQNQVSAIVPYAVADRGTVPVEVEWQGQRSAAVRLNVGGASPGIFTQDSTGVGQASAQNQDGSVNSSSNPAAAGSVIVLYGTGEGAVFPTGADGRVATTERPLQTVTVSINGVSVTPEYAGSSPGQIVGLLQVNVRIPAGVSGATIPVRLTVGGVQSREGVTISVR